MPEMIMLTVLKLSMLFLLLLCLSLCGSKKLAALCELVFPEAQARFVAVVWSIS